MCYIRHLLDYLDVTLNVSDGLYKHFYQTSNSAINHIHRKSNHPRSIIKQLPLSLESRLSKLISDENAFVGAASVYQEPLKRVGYNHKLNCNNSDKHGSNNNNDKDNCNNNATKNDNNYNNNKLKFNDNISWDNNDNNSNKNNCNSYENKGSNDNNNNKVKFNSNDNKNNINIYNFNSEDNRDNF